MTYRLAPAAPWPAGSEDVGAAVRFLHAASARWGGDPKGIFLMGQSAGAVHVAGYVAEPRLHALPNGDIAGAIMISGLYDVARADRNPFQAAYYGQDPDALAGAVHARENWRRPPFPASIVFPNSIRPTSNARPRGWWKHMLPGVDDGRA